MGINCYAFEAPVEVCVDGPVGNGDTATLTVFVTDVSTDGTTLPSSIDSPVGTVPNWDGSTEVFEGWLDPSFGSCGTLLSSKLTVTLVGDDAVEVTVEIRVDDCGELSGFYNDCGGPGPHTFTDTKIVPMTGGPCSS